MVHIVISILEVVEELHDFFILFFLLGVLEDTLSRTASLHPWEVPTPLCSNSGIGRSPLPNSHLLTLLWMASVTIFVMVGRQVIGR